MDKRRLPRLVSQYVRRFAPHRRANHERYADMPNLSTAIRNAALARRSDGKCESHQRRIGMNRLKLFNASLQAVSSNIKRCQTFDELHDLIAEHRPYGIGRLAIYDTAARIGDYLGLPPTKVYLHAGTAVGAMHLGLETGTGCVLLDDLPMPLRQLTADEVEDFLCIYKGAFRGRSVVSGCKSGPKRRKIRC